MYFIKDKKYTRNPKESDRCPEATAGPNQRRVSCLPTDSEQEVQNRRLSLPPIFYNSVYNSSQQLRYTTTTTTTDYWRRSAYHVYYYYRRYQGRLCLQSQELRKVSFQELLILHKDTNFLQPHLRRIIVSEPSIIVLKS